MWERIKTALSRNAGPADYFVAAIALVVILLLIVALGGCSRDADVASRNLSYAADDFQVNRRIVFYNGITGDYMLTIEGLCSLGNDRTSSELSITCKTGPSSYKKHFLGLSDNVTFFVEHIEPSSVSTYHYDVVFKPSTIIPDMHVK